MERLIGTVSRGVRAPIIRQGDDLVQIVADSVLKAAATGKTSGTTAGTTADGTSGTTGTTTQP